MVEGEVVARPACTVSLSFDHRVLDGATAGRALTDLVALLQDADALRRLAAMKIVSLLPSATEIVYALGLGDDLIGVTDECDFPPEAVTKPVVSRSALPQGRPLDVARDRRGRAANAWMRGSRSTCSTPTSSAASSPT